MRTNNAAPMLKRNILNFVILESMIYGAFTMMDIISSNPTLNRISVLLKLMSIALCLAFLVHLLVIQKSNRDNRLMVLILSFTFASDVLLLLTRQFIYGLILFVCVQLLYNIRIHKHFKVKSMILYGSFFIASLIFMQRISQNFNDTVMLSLGALYALLFAMNLIALTHEIWPIPRANDKNELAKTGAETEAETVYNKHLFLIGLILYALCDLNVVIYNFPSFFDSNAILMRLYEMSALAMWLFYLPGQVALTLSVKHNSIEVNTHNL